jgi:hypothetical protein
MKRTLLLFTLITIAIFSCKKKETVDPAPQYAHLRPYTGIVTAFKNGQPWIANAFAANRIDTSGAATDRFFVYLDHYEKRGADSIFRDFLWLDYLKYQVYKTDLAGDSAHWQNTGAEYISHINSTGSDIAELPSSLFKSEPHWWQLSNRPGEPDNLYSTPHFQQCRVIAIGTS